MKKVKLTTVTLALLAGTVVTPVVSTTVRAEEANKVAQVDENKKEVRDEKTATSEQPNTQLDQKQEEPKQDTTTPKAAEKTELEKAKEAAMADAQMLLNMEYISYEEFMRIDMGVANATTVEEVKAVVNGTKKPTEPTEPVKPAEKTELEKAKEAAMADAKMQLGMNYISEEEYMRIDMAIANATTIEAVNEIIKPTKPTEPVKPVEKTELEKAKEKAMADAKMQLGMDYISYEEYLRIDMAIANATTIEAVNEIMGYKPTEPTKPEVDKELEAAKNQAFAELKAMVDEGIVGYEDGLVLMDKINDATSIDELKSLGFLNEVKPEVDKELEAAKDQAFAELKEWFNEGLVTYEESWELTGKINDATSIDELKALGFLKEDKPEVDKELEAAKDHAFAELKEWFNEGLVTYEEAWELTGKINDAKSIDELKALGFLSENEAKENQSTVTVKYVDQDGKEIKEADTLTKEKGTKHTFEAAEISRYELQGPSSLEVEFSDSPQTITFTYKAIEEAKETESTVTVKYVDQDGKEIKEADTLTKEKGTKHTFEAAEISKYELQGPSSLEVEFSDVPQTITFTYKAIEEAKETESTVTVKYVDQDGKEIKEADTLTKEIGAKHTFKAAEVTGYEVEGPSSLDVEFSDSPQTITFTYKAIEEAKETESTVTVKYVDQAGKEIKAADTLTKEIGVKHTFKASEIAGYVLEGPSSLEVEFSDVPQTVTFTYKAIEEVKENQSTITVKYVDKSGKEIKESESLTKEIGTKHTFKAAKIKGYKLVSPESLELTFSDSPQNVEFVYEKDNNNDNNDNNNDNNNKNDNKNNSNNNNNKGKTVATTNKKSTLPQTGEEANTGAVTGGLLSMLTAAFVFFRKKR
ncbi:MucBP domain-containing protein [Vagococcus carniphilus]|uniref:MucBP domain-containing protein n=1 Tax=Vagococcus carniphilus TaxID=218144 RepID=A0AAW8U5J7_9ENTE|nr:MucBP domain-containing protein [Vagococcus carniphilus]MDT2834920.1 MucBP domain-containing protein [Vagococcus carniphilus]